jgi:protoporphyrinogen oxidase
VSEKPDTVVIGGGPAGCTAALTLVNSGYGCSILDKHDVPGGLSRSIKRNGATFDIGPHRLLTKSETIFNIWHSILDDDLIEVDRLTRILYKGKLFNYPLSPMNALLGLGALTSCQAFVSYGLRRLKRAISPKIPTSFEDWVSDNFGTVLYEAFFKHYTEKVWGIPCAEISSDWASQRIKGLTLLEAVYNAVTNHKRSRVKTLADHFLYPRHGAGYLYERMIDQIKGKGVRYVPNATVTSILREPGEWIVTYRRENGIYSSIECAHVLSSIPLTDMINMLSPAPPSEVQSAAAALKFRDHYCVNLLVKGSEKIFPDNWIYVHSPELTMGRIANYTNFCSLLSDDESLFPITVEVFSFQGDEFSNLTDAGRIDTAITELRHVGLLNSARQIEDAFVVFSAAAYPVIQLGYRRQVGIIRAYLNTLEGFQTMGRGGLFQYDNQDHSSMTGILAARNVMGCDYDVWSVNTDAGYHESGTAPNLCAEDRYGPHAE